jgi:hypothetical protein
MDLNKAKVYLDKINRDFARMSRDTDNIARIDVDILMSYIRDLYDACLAEASVSMTAPPRTAAPAPRKATVQEFAPPPAEMAPPPAPVVEAPPAPAPPTPPQPVYAQEAPPPVYIPEPAPPPPTVRASEPAPPPPPVRAPESAPPPPPPPVVEAPKPAASSGKEIDLLFEQKQAKELSEKLSEMPIADLRKAIALNDRLLLTRELFGGDATAFETAIQTLNGFSNFDQAKNWIVDNCVARFNWTDKNTAEDAKRFIKLIRRRYK